MAGGGASSSSQYTTTNTTTKTYSSTDVANSFNTDSGHNTTDTNTATLTNSNNTNFDSNNTTLTGLQGQDLANILNLFGESANTGLNILNQQAAINNQSQLNLVHDFLAAQNGQLNSVEQSVVPNSLPNVSNPSNDSVTASGSADSGVAGLDNFQVLLSLIGIGLAIYALKD